MRDSVTLHGLGLRSGVGPARCSLQKPGGPSFDVTLAPVTAAAYLRSMRPDFPSFVYALPRRAAPLCLRRRAEGHYVTTLDHGRVVFVGYNLTLGSTFPEAQRSRSSQRGARCGA